MSRPFFYKIEASEFFAETLKFKSDKELGKFIRQFAIDLVTCSSSSPYSDRIILEAVDYIEKKRRAGSKGGKQKASSAKASLEQTDSTGLASSSNNSNTEAKEENHNLSSSDDEGSTFLFSDQEQIITRKKRTLKGARLEAFMQFWNAFNYKHGRAEAADAWIDIPQLTRTLVEKIVDAAKKESANRPDMIRQGRTPKMAQGWISARRWEDEASVLNDTEENDFTRALQASMSGRVSA